MICAASVESAAIKANLRSVILRQFSLNNLSHVLLGGILSVWSYGVTGLKYSATCPC